MFIIQGPHPDYPKAVMHHGYLLLTCLRLPGALGGEMHPTVHRRWSCTQAMFVRPGRWVSVPNVVRPLWGAFQGCWVQDTPVGQHQQHKNALWRDGSEFILDSKPRVLPAAFPRALASWVKSRKRCSFVPCLFVFHGRNECFHCTCSFQLWPCTFLTMRIIGFSIWSISKLGLLYY